MKIFIYLLLFIATCPLVSAQHIFTGGSGDGWTFSSYSQSFTNIFTGGNGDGWAKNAAFQSSLNIFSGGNGDGWATLPTLTGASLYVCAAGNSSLAAHIVGNAYQWQLDSGNGFVNILNGVNYNGVTTPVLTLINIPSSYYGYRIRCVTNGVPGAAYILKIAAYWTGSVNTAWETTGNWGCGVLPDANTDVFIYGGKSNYPLINTNTSCRSISANAGTSVTISEGRTIILTGH